MCLCVCVCVCVCEREREHESLSAKELLLVCAYNLYQYVYLFLQAFEAVTILFSNLVGFDEISNNAMDSVRVINHCFTIFDPIVDKHNLYKVWWWSW